MTTRTTTCTTTGTVRPRRARALTATALAGVSAVVLSGCQFNGVASFPLPGGKGTGGNTYSVALMFPDVLDLVPQSSVKVNDVSVGSVKKIELVGYEAKVTVTVEDSVVLPRNIRATLRQTSLLGEKFISLDRPTDTGPVGRLKDGDLLTDEQTSRNSEIEEVLGALSLVINGGSLEQIKTINTELSAALKGREPAVRNTLEQLNTFVTGLDKQKADIVRALDNLDKLTQRLAREKGTIATALDDLPGGARVLADETDQLTKVVQGLDRLGQVSTRLITASKTDTVADLKLLQPILTNLAKSGQDLPNALELLTTYPFPKTVDTGIRGDYANLYITVQGALDSGNGLPNSPIPGVPLPTLPTLPGAGKTPTPTVTVPPVVPKLPALPDVGTKTGNELRDLLLGGLK